MDEYKINILGERIGMGRFDDDEGYSLLVHQTKIGIEQSSSIEKEYPILANIWNLYSYCRFRCEHKR